MNKWILCFLSLAISAFGTDFHLDFQLEHINSEERLRAFKSQYPEIDEDVLEEGYHLLPDENDFSPALTELMIKCPVWGTWLIVLKDSVIGRITLLKPSMTIPRSEILSWVKPSFRNAGIGKRARQLIYENILRFVGHSLDVGFVVNSRNNIIKTQHIENYQGVLSQISIENYGSLISQISSGATIVDYVGEAPRVALLKLAFPKFPPNDELKIDPVLWELKNSIEPTLVSRESRALAISQLKALERGPLVGLQNGANPRDVVRIKVCGVLPEYFLK